jgi:CHORD
LLHGSFFLTSIFWGGREKALYFLTNIAYSLGWKCCKPRVLTFDEFLAIPPCTTGKHSTTDHPPVLEKSQPELAVVPTPSPSSPAAPKSTSEAPRAPISLPSRSAAPSPPPVVDESDEDDPSLDIPDGRLCKRRACGHVYKTDDERKDEKCVYHPGAPLFHEGSKGYTCCKRRVLEFDEFMKIEGCKTKEKHLFVGTGKRKGGGKENADGEEILETVR